MSGHVVAFAGDWHGDTQWAIARVQSAAAQGIKVIFHVGDFGIWPGPLGKKYLTAVENACAANDLTIMVTPGNHEDWNRILGKKTTDRGDGWGAVKWLTDHVAVFPRGHRFTMTTPSGVTRSFVSLGGAASIDYFTRVEGRDWWREELFTDAEVDEVVAGGYADVMIAHECPDIPYAVDVVAGILRYNPQGWPPNALAYARIGRDRMTRAYEGVSPKWFFHGHYHEAGVKQVVDMPAGLEEEAWVVSLDQQRTASNIARLDLDLLELV